ncbi:MAG: hypothetical protein HUU32_14270 [Calditrichaceae bacterium]|nr:hypothetical protein [Calditrichia bacterium]NUQ42550.1 hypothetical protein [Calditrichaceae bacterium]
MRRSFEVHLDGRVEQFLEKARKANQRSEIDFSGDAHSGNFAAWGVKGNYTILEGVAHIHIIEKPPLIPWYMVENMVRDFFA